MSSAKWRPFCLGLNVLMDLTGDKLLPDGTKPLLEPKLTYIYVALWRH